MANAAAMGQRSSKISETRGPRENAPLSVISCQITEANVAEIESQASLWRPNWLRARAPKGSYYLAASLWRFAFRICIPFLGATALDGLI